MTNVGYRIRNGWLQKPPLGVQLNWTCPLTKDLVGCWLFNEGGGDKVYDLSGYNNHGTLENMAFPPTPASGWNPGKDGVGLVFDGNNDHINCGNDASLNCSGAITIEAWVKPTSVSAGSRPLVDKEGSGTREPYYFYQSDETLNIMLSQDATTRAFGNTGNILTTNWQHVAVTYDKKNIRFFHNGIEITNTGSNPTFSLRVTTDPLYLGSKATDAFFNGTIAMVRIYNRALLAEEIQQLYIAPYAMFEPATKYTIVDERLETDYVGGNVMAAELI